MSRTSRQYQYEPERRYPHRRRRGYRLHPVRLLFALGLIAALVVIAALLVSYARGRRGYDDLRDAVLATPTPAVVTPPADTQAPGEAAPATPSPTPELSFTVDWAALKKKNRHVRAWLYCPDTNLSYPVVQYTDNTYYLTHNFDRDEDDAGALYFDCGTLFSNGFENWIIYGHRRNDGSMFGSLVKFSEESYWQAHPVMYLLTEERTYRVELFSCRTVHAYPEYFTLWFEDARAFQKYIDKTIEHSYWSPGFAVDTDYPILTLATCSTYGHDSDPRLLVHGRLVPIE